MPEEIQGFLHPRHLPVPEGRPCTILRVSRSPSPPLHTLIPPPPSRSAAELTSRPPSVCVCRCLTSYSGDRCQFFTLPVEKPQGGYNRTTALAVVAVVLSSVCLIIIGLLLLLRYGKDPEPAHT